MVKRSGSHIELYFHYVWTTKNREPMIDAEIEREVQKALFSKAKELEIEIVESNGTEDHVHILIRSKATLTPADIAKHMKGTSSHFVNHVILKGDPIRSLYWQDGYGVVSVSPGAVRSVQQYIRNQKEHHRSGKVQGELEVSQGSGVGDMQ